VRQRPPIRTFLDRNQVESPVVLLCAGGPGHELEQSLAAPAALRSTPRGLGDIPIRIPAAPLDLDCDQRVAAPCEQIDLATTHPQIPVHDVVAA
jgi:hypothetical protein